MRRWRGGGWAMETERTAAPVRRGVVLGALAAILLLRLRRSAPCSAD